MNKKSKQWIKYYKRAGGKKKLDMNISGMMMILDTAKPTLMCLSASGAFSYGKLNIIRFLSSITM